MGKGEQDRSEVLRKLIAQRDHLFGFTKGDRNERPNDPLLVGKIRQIDMAIEEISRNIYRLE